MWVLLVTWQCCVLMKAAVVCCCCLLQEERADVLAGRKITGGNVGWKNILGIAVCGSMSV